MKVGRIAERQTMRKQNAEMKATLTRLKVVDRAYLALEHAFQKGFTQGYDAGKSATTETTTPVQESAAEVS